MNFFFNFPKTIKKIIIRNLRNSFKFAYIFVYNAYFVMIAIFFHQIFINSFIEILFVNIFKKMKYKKIWFIIKKKSLT